MKGWLLAVPSALGLIFALIPALAQSAFDEQSVAKFYRGKTVKIVVGLGAGGSYDITAPDPRKPSVRTSGGPL